MSRLADTTGRSDRTRRHRSVHTPGPMALVWITVAAEGIAHRLFRSLAVQATGLEWLAEGLTDGSVQLRSLLKKGRAFKGDIADQTSSDEVLRMLRLARLPHWVWVVEAHHRPVCSSGHPCVVATALFDSTSFDLDPHRDVLALPGVVAVYPPDGGAPVVAPGSPDPWRSALPVH